MQRVDGAMLFSATDLVQFVACEHLTELERSAVLGEIERPSGDDPALELISRRGGQHEQRFLEQLHRSGREIVEIPWAGASAEGLQAAHQATIQAVRDGAEVIYQAMLLDVPWRGYADFLIRTDAQTGLGSYGYEIYDTKLARRVRASALLQMCSYAELLERIQGAPSEQMHVVLGTMETESFRVRDFSAYYRAVKRRFEQGIAEAAQSSYPEPVEHCAVCIWRDRCDQRRRDDDHLSLVANMRREQTRKLSRVGITTVAELAASAPDLRVKGIGEPTLTRLRQQAALQLRQRVSGEVAYELIVPERAGQGLAGLPEPSPGDLFFDMEGDPFVEEGGLEYLFGMVEVVNGEPMFHPFWAHSREEEKLAFEAFIDFVMERLERDPNLHVYHYADYEASALKTLMGRHATREVEVDALLRRNVLVDLYAVVRQGLRVSQESYSIKKLEPLYMEKRDEAIQDATSSIVAYEHYLETENPADLDEIEAYNKFDCVSTWRLREWLEARRQELAAQTGEAVPRPDSAPTVVSEKRATEDAEVRGLVDALTSGSPDSASGRSPEQQARWLLAQLLEWHRRDEKPAWWEYFNRLNASDEELVDDAEAIGQVSYVGVVGSEKQSLIHRYRFDPNQEHKLLLGDTPSYSRTGQGAGTIVSLDNRIGQVKLKRRRSRDEDHPTSLISGGPFDSRALRQALQRAARSVMEASPEAPLAFQAAWHLLRRQPPQLTGRAPGDRLVQPGESPLDAARRLVMQLDGSYLAIQGPPGTGKTYTGAQMILDLVKAGRRVGICALSHRAIGNLLDAVCVAAEREGVELRAMQKAPERDRCQSPLIRATESNDTIVSALASSSVDVVAGTPWLFSRAAVEGTLDVLFVDEAGQLSLANTVAIAGAARNLVLLGDPQQLQQPSQGVHPPGAEQSALGHIVGAEATVPPELGILLDTTWRMHPRVCDCISEIAYASLLKAHESCSGQTLIGQGPLAGSGLRLIPSVHEGNRSSSPEEIDQVKEAIETLLGLEWQDAGGEVRRLRLEDILIVAPYNVHVARLQEALGDGARVGTVDKFQGQEAPVVIYTTATSTAEEIPRGIEFLFSLNRLNVAISRARGLAIMITSPALLQAPCRSVGQMRLLNAYCRYAELATEY